MNPMHRVAGPLALAGTMLFINVRIFVAYAESDG